MGEEFTKEHADLLSELRVAVFGLKGDGQSGLLHEMRQLRRSVERLHSALVKAAVTFGIGTISIAASIVLG